MIEIWFNIYMYCAFLYSWASLYLKIILIKVIFALKFDSFTKPTHSTHDLMNDGDGDEKVVTLKYFVLNIKLRSMMMMHQRAFADNNKLFSKKMFKSKTNTCLKSHKNRI